MSQKGKGGKNGGGEGQGQSLASQLADNPAMLAALQALQNQSQGQLEALPLEITRRVNALKNLQLQHAQLQIRFEKEVLALEQKYVALHQPLYQKRSTIVTGDYEPTEQEATFKGEDEEEEGEKPKASEQPLKGIPDFWLTVLQNNDYVAQMIEEHDLPILQHVTDITVEYFTEPQTGYRLHFLFSPNEYFTNNELIKTYVLSYEADDNPLLFEGPSYEKAEGTVINWNEGKNVTVKQEKKKQKKKGGKDAGKTRTITKTVKQPSFFHFFSPPQPMEAMMLTRRARSTR